MAVTKTYAEIFFPGFPFSESSVREVKSRDISKLEIPDSAFGVRFYDRAETVVDGETLYGDRKNLSGTTYFGEVVSLDEAKEKYNTGALVSNMEGNGWNYVVKTRVGNFQPINDEDSVIGENGQKIWPVSTSQNQGAKPTPAP